MDDFASDASPSDIANAIGLELFGGDSTDTGNNALTTIDNDTGQIVDPQTQKQNDLPQTVQKSGTPATQQNSQVQTPALKPIPKSWKKEMEPHWSKLDPAVHDYVYSREADVMRGIQMYQEGYTNWNETLKPFQEILKQYPDVKPVPLIQQLVHNHISLVHSTPEQRLSLARELLKHYQIDPAALVAGGTPGTGNQNQPDPVIAALRQEVQTLKQALTGMQTSQQQSALAAKTQEVAAFFADPKNEYAEEVGENILHLLKTGAAADLPAAYELACLMNPAVRAKMFAKQQADASKGTQNNSKPPKNINDSGDTSVRTRTGKNSWEDDVDGIVQKHFSPH